MELSVLDSIVLGLAFSLSMFVVSNTVAKNSNMRYTKGILQSVVMACFNALFLYVGVWITSLFRIGELDYDRWLMVGVLVIVAIKLIVNVIKKRKENNAILIAGFKSMLFLSIAVSVDAFIVGMGIGFCYEPNQFNLALITIMVLGTLVSIAGVFTGRQAKAIPYRMLVAVEALLFVELAIKLFIEVV